jgi:hypothetical protein
MCIDWDPKLQQRRNREGSYGAYGNSIWKENLERQPNINVTKRMFNNMEEENMMAAIWLQRQWH